MPTSRDVYTITPLDVGLCSLGKDHVLGDQYSPDDRLQFALISFLIQGSGRSILVDLGPKTLDYTNAMFRHYGFFRTMPDGSTPDDITQRKGSILDQLRTMGRHRRSRPISWVTPEQITDIVFTHLHADHHGMDDATDGGACEDFPNAVFWVSGRGWQRNLDNRRDGRWNSYVDHAFGDFLLRMRDQGRLMAIDDAQVAPGVETMYLGGHSFCSQGVRVRTTCGDAIIAGDEVYRYDLFERGILARVHTTPDALVRSNRGLAQTAVDGTIVLPCHEPLLLELYDQYGESWLSEAKRVSRSAGASALLALP